MRISLLTLCFLVFNTGCNKKNTYSICDLTQLEIIQDGAPTTFINYQYDAAGKIKRVMTESWTDVYDYFTDSVVVIGSMSPSGFVRTTYFLNGAGVATSAKTILSPNPNGLQTDYLYNYDAAGYLISEREIFTQLYNGNILHDTTFRTYNVVNGDIVKKTETNGTDFLFEYSTDVMPDNVPMLNPFPSREGSFLGKHPIHLVSKSDANYSYSFDRGKKVSEMKSSFPGANSTQRMLFHYACD